MDIVYAGAGPVGTRCRDVLDALKLSYTCLDGDVPKCDLLVSVHWPHIFTTNELRQCKVGAINVHNSYLPYNRGADACSWAIVDQTPHGATMHWIDEGIDTGPILYQEKLPSTAVAHLTADELYAVTAKMEVIVFRKGIELILSGKFPRKPQPTAGTFHQKADFKLLTNAVTTRDWKAIQND